MKRVYQAAALTFVGFGGLIVWESSKLRYYSTLGPGPGFFPLWLGAVMVFLATLWLVQVSVGPADPVPDGFWPDRRGAVRVLAVALSLVFMTAAMDPLGFRISMFLVLAFLLYVLGRQSVLVTAVVSLLGSFGFYYALTAWLGGSLPTAGLDLLAGFGL
jgi:putative tricarboxylic transport membrane protein